MNKRQRKKYIRKYRCKGYQFLERIDFICDEDRNYLDIARFVVHNIAYKFRNVNVQKDFGLIIDNIPKNIHKVSCVNCKRKCG